MLFLAKDPRVYYMCFFFNSSVRTPTRQMRAIIGQPPIQINIDLFCQSIPTKHTKTIHFQVHLHKRPTLAERLSQLLISVGETESMVNKRKCGSTPDSVDESSPTPLVVICTPNVIGS